jgi:hypothetical protein
MAVILPEAEWRPFSGKSTTPVQPDILVAHTEVGSNEGSISWGAKAGNPYAHNYTSCGGKTVQCQDLKHRSAAVLEGNPYAICWETEDTKSACFADWDHTCGNVPAWTNAQVQRLIKDMAWCCVRFNIPPVLIPDTKKGRRGLAYHRQGVPNSPEWVTGNLSWTKSTGKCCPDWRRIDQFKTKVVPGVRALVLGEDDMYGWTEDEFKTVIRNIIKQEVPGLVDAKVTEVLEREIQESGSVLRKEGRVLAKLGAEDALKAVPPPV